MISTRIVGASDAGRNPAARAKWEQLLEQHAGTTLFYQSPEYFHHLAKFRADSAFLAIVEGDDGAPIGIVPMRKSDVLLKFEARDYYFAHVSFSGIRILGGTLLAPQSPEIFERLFREIARSFPNCDAMELIGVPTTSLLWDFLKTSRTLKRDFAIYAPNGPRNCHTAAIPETFAKYLGAFGRKKQYNLKRQIRRLDEFSKGSLTLHRIDHVAAIECFHKAQIVLGGIPKRDGDGELSESELVDFAERGLLLSYVLSIDGKPCALAVGTRFRDTLVVHSFRHDIKIAHFSPGTVLQTLMMRDLAENKLVRRIDYGFGEPRYRLNNDIDERVSVVMVRKGLINQSLIASHMSYVRVLEGIKRLMRI